MEKRSVRRRAVHDEQKEERRQAILTAAWQCFQATSYEALTMASIADVLHLAKGTLFLYFETKEALFLALVQQQLDGWFAAVDAHLSALDGNGNSSQIVTLFYDQLEARPGLTRLLAILHTLLEHNIDLATARDFKHFLLQHFTHTGTLLERSLTFLTPGAGAHLLLRSHALVIGIWHLADPAPVVRQALQQPELQMFEVHFATEFPETLHLLLAGMEREAQKAHKKVQQEGIQ